MTIKLCLWRLGKAAVAAGCLALAVGCGGGGGGSAGAPPPDTGTGTVAPAFALQSALKARTLAGTEEEFTISGSCSGTAVMRSDKPKAADLEGALGYLVGQSSQVDLTDCAPSRVEIRSDTYLDANYVLMGSATLGQEYAKFAVAPLPLPASVKVGDAATIVTLNTYTSPAKTLATGRRTWGYVVEPDTVNSVIVNFETRTFNASDLLLQTQQARYRLRSNGDMTVLSIEIRYSNTREDRLVFTPTRIVSSGSFALQRAYQTRLLEGSIDNFTVSGTCNGKSMIEVAPAQSAMFEGVTGWKTTQVNKLSLVDCAPANLEVVDLGYFDTTFTPLGSAQVGLDFAKFSAPPLALPASVKVGDTGTLANLSTFTNESQLVPTGRRELAYAIEPDSATTATVNFKSTSYNASEQVLFTQQIRYRIDASNKLELVSIDAQYSTTSNVQLFYRTTRAVGSALKFPLALAYRARVAAGSSERLAVSGSCSGKATITEGVPVSVNFEGAAALASSQTALLNFADCSPNASSVSGTNYYDATFGILGSITVGQEYAKVTGTAAALPTLVQVGDSGSVATLNLFTDNSKSVSTGRRQLTYLLEADSPNTAIVNFVARTYSPTDQLVSTQQSRYRIQIDGGLKLVSIEFQGAAPGSLRVVYTPIPGVFTQVPTWPV